jgi:hypothetical protein
MHKTVIAEDLKDPERYTLIKVLGHDEIIEFILDQAGQLRWPMVFFYGFSILLLVPILVFSLANIAYTYISWGMYWKYLALGMVSGMLVVIPFHELLHGLAYRLAGAEKVKYGADMKQMLFYASAPGFVAGKYDFYMVAFTPFIILNLVFLS